MVQFNSKYVLLNVEYSKTCQSGHLYKVDTSVKWTHFVSPECILFFVIYNHNLCKVDTCLKWTVDTQFSSKTVHYLQKWTLGGHKCAFIHENPTSSAYQNT